MNLDSNDQNFASQTTTLKASPSSGGQVNNRGIIIQTIVALLEAVNQEPPFDTLTLEPAEGDDQFDFIWSRGSERHAIQVKTSRTTFSVGMIKEYAGRMALARKNVNCKLILVGPMDVKVSAIEKTGWEGVCIQTEHMGNPDDRTALLKFRGQCTIPLVKVLPKLGLSEGLQADREKMVDELNGNLILRAATGTSMTHEEFLRILKGCFPEDLKNLQDSTFELPKLRPSDIFTLMAGNTPPCVPHLHLRELDRYGKIADKENAVLIEEDFYLGRHPKKDELPSKIEIELPEEDKLTLPYHMKGLCPYQNWDYAVYLQRGTIKKACLVSPAASSVSRLHAQFVFRGGKWFVRREPTATGDSIISVHPPLKNPQAALNDLDNPKWQHLIKAHSANMKIAIQDGAIIILGFRSFVIELGR